MGTNKKTDASQENIPGLDDVEKVIIRLLRLEGEQCARQLARAKVGSIGHAVVCTKLIKLHRADIVRYKFGVCDTCCRGGRVKKYTLNEKGLEEWAHHRQRQLQFGGKRVRKIK